jgi:hypothetical protein
MCINTGDYTYWCIASSLYWKVCPVCVVASGGGWLSDVRWRGKTAYKCNSRAVSLGRQSGRLVNLNDLT